MNALRKVTMLLIAALILGSGLNLAPQGASALTPGTPRLMGVIGRDHSVLFGWSVPDSGGKPATQYKVERYLGDEAQPQKVFVLGGQTMWMVDKGLANNTVYRYRVQAWNQDGPSPWSAKEAAQPKEYRTALAPFEDANTFVKRQYQDLLGRQPSAQELTAGKAMIDEHDTTELTDFLARHDVSAVDRVFLWQGDARILVAIVKDVEDRLNVEHDTGAGGVQVILVIEDNVRYYSSLLPTIYGELLHQSQQLISEGLNLSQKILRMRARPKILLCRTFEEAWSAFSR